MELLRTVTAVYGAALAATLAGGLVMMAVYLRRIGVALADARAALDEIVVETAPLEEHLRRLAGASADWAEQLGVARPRLARVERTLAVAAGGREGRLRVGRANGPTRGARAREWVSRLFGG